MSASRSLAGLALVTIAFALLPLASPPAFLESFLYLLFFWIAMATSWTILSGYAGYVSFGHGAFYGVGIYAMANFGPRLPLLACLLLAGLCAAGLGVLVGFVVFRVKRLRGELFALLTLALAIVLATIVLNTPIDGGPGVSLMSVTLPRLYRNASSTIYVMGLVVCMGSLAVAWSVQHSRLGRGLFAISDDEDVAEVLGVPTLAFKIIAFAISSFLAGVAGGVHALFIGYVTVPETFSITTPLFVLLMSVLGGTRTWIGPAIGAIFVTTLNNTLVGGDWALLARAAIGLTLIVATLYLPEGVAGLVQARWRRRAAPAVLHAEVAPATATPASEPAAAQADGAAREVLLKAQGISLAFRGVQALDAVDVEIRKGEILGLVGPNGSGKSTLINVLSGFYKPDAGRILFGGEDLAQVPGHRVAGHGIARTFQIPRPFARQSVFENVMLAASFGAGGLDRAAAEAKARETLAFVGLAERADALPAELNLHQRKFLELARALASEARLIMLDEVLAGITPAEITSAIELVRRIHKRDTTILFVEHNIRAVLALTERLIVLDQGHLIADGDPRAVMNDPAVVRAYLGESDAGH
jgi:branched-chain amino acid transport system permease protein